MEEIEKKKARLDFDVINATLKEIFKQLKLFYSHKAKGLPTVFTQEDATTLVARLKEIFLLIQSNN